MHGCVLKSTPLIAFVGNFDEQPSVLIGRLLMKADLETRQ